MEGASKVPKKAIIIAGGEGTRLRPLTYEMPKSLVPVLGKPMMDYILDELKRNEISEVILAIGYKAHKIEEHYKANPVQGIKVTYSEETERLGTGGAIKLALSKAGNEEDVIVINGDTMFKIEFAKMFGRHVANKSVATLAVTVENPPSGKGVVVLNGEKIVDFVEKPDPRKAKSNFISTGIYILNRKIGEHFPDEKVFSIEKMVFEKMAQTGGIYGYEFDKFFTINNFEEYREVERQLKQGKLS